MNILEAFKIDNKRAHGFDCLAESMRNGIEATLEMIQTDYEYYMDSKEKAYYEHNTSHYQMTSYSIQLGSISHKKLRKIFNLSMDKTESHIIIQVIRNKLKSYISNNKRLNDLRLVLYPELGDITNRLHFHGVYFGRHCDIDYIAKWWRRNVGFFHYKLYSGHKWIDEYIIKQQDQFNTVYIQKGKL